MAVLIVAGALANKPHNGGEAWVRLGWVLGLRRLGHEVYFGEQIDPATCTDDAGRPVAFGASVNRRYFEQVTGRFGIAEASTLLCGDEWFGLPPTRLRAVAERADALFNISGHLRVEALLSPPPRRVYVDIDPGFTQVWHAQGADLGLDRHNVHYTIGWHIGTPGCPIPTGGFDWRRVRPPVVLEHWPALAPHSPDAAVRFTTIASWRPNYGSLEWGGVTYGLKLHEFRRLIDLPRRRPGLRFELALHIYPGDEKDRIALVEHGWTVVAPDVATTPHDFRDYVAGSGAEFSAAQGVYVHARTGWFSDRTATYLASGRPALVQDTGLASSGLPTGLGLVPFGTAEEAAAGAESIAANYTAHCAAARRVAEEHFDSDRVLARLLQEIGL
jgi:hypothetical protein